jgi:hypothetical protein
VLELLSDLPPWQLALAAAWILLQGCVMPSVPEEIVIVTLGMLVGQGRLEPPLALTAVLAGLLPANSATVSLGSLGRRRLGGEGRLGRAIASRGVAAAAAALRSVARPEMAPRLCEMLASAGRPDRRAAIAEVLGALGDPAAEPVLLAALSDTVARVRAGAATALGQLRLS